MVAQNAFVILLLLATSRCVAMKIRLKASQHAASICPAAKTVSELVATSECVYVNPIQLNFVATLEEANVLTAVERNPVYFLDEFVHPNHTKARLEIISVSSGPDSVQ